MSASVAPCLTAKLRIPAIQSHCPAAMRFWWLSSALRSAISFSRKLTCVCRPSTCLLASRSPSMPDSKLSSLVRVRAYWDSVLMTCCSQCCLSCSSWSANARACWCLRCHSSLSACWASLSCSTSRSAFTTASSFRRVSTSLALCFDRSEPTASSAPDPLPVACRRPRTSSVRAATSPSSFCRSASSSCCRASVLAPIWLATCMASSMDCSASFSF
mmetsp:Transcript_40821/g.73101  ORF Transcript_40821/g.73101 Transcript_40821/m.73101 type:complete len:216 (+) Transcript_40821:285-932(+)